MKEVKLGSQGLKVSELGYGCMGLTTAYGTRLEDDEIVEVLKKVYENGINFWDTANLYVYLDFWRIFSLKSPLVCQEEIIGRAIKEVGREKIVIATKTGVKLHFFPHLNVVPCGDPAFVRQQCEDSLRRLDVDCIDLFYLHRIDPNIPIEVTMATMKDLVQEGKIKYVGLSECSAKTLRRAHAVHPITCIQVEWSLWCRGVEKGLAPTCAELGVGIVPYSPLGRGFFGSTKVREQKLERGDFRSDQERLQGSALAQNIKLLEKVEAIAAAKSVSTPQLVLAWLLHKRDLVNGAGVVPIPGTTKIKNLESNAKAVDVDLTPEDMKALEVIGEATGDRYQAGHQTWEVDNNKELTA